MIFVQKDTTTPVVVELPERADATPAFVVKNPAGTTAQASAAVTLDSVNTTLNGAAVAGATSVAVTSAAGVTVGKTYLVGGGEDTGGEFVTVKSISGTTLALVRPLRMAKANGSTFAGTRVTCAITGTNVGTVGRHWRVEITYAVGGTTRAVLVAPFDVARYEPQTYLTLERVRAADPLFAKRLAEGAWWPSLRDEAWTEILQRCAARVDPGALIGARDMTIPHGYLVRMLAAEPGGRELDEYRQMLATRFAQTFDVALGAIPVDNDGDGAVENHEGAPRAVEILRG